MINRIFQIMHHYGLGDSEFANEIGITKAMLSSAKNGRTQPSLHLISQIKLRYPNVSLNWVMFGTGEMFEDSSTFTHPADERIDNDTLPSLFDQQSGVVNQQLGVMEIQAEVASENSIQASQTTNMPQGVQQHTSERKITKVIVYYSDNSFQEFL